MNNSQKKKKACFSNSIKFRGLMPLYYWFQISEIFNAFVDIGHHCLQYQNNGIILSIH